MAGCVQATSSIRPIRFARRRNCGDKHIGRHQVVIVGGGLAGLTAAVDLGVRGIPCVLLDDNNTVSLGSRSIAQGKRTMEIATRLGISERMMPKGISWSKGNTLVQDKLLYSFDLLPDGHEKYQAFLCLPQYYVEAMLVERASGLSACRHPLVEPRRRPDEGRRDGASERGDAAGKLSSSMPTG